MNLVLLFILQVILIILLLIFLYTLFKESRVIDIEKRLSAYSIPNIDEQSIPMFERLYKNLWKIIRKNIKFIYLVITIKNFIVH